MAESEPDPDLPVAEPIESSIDERMQRLEAAVAALQNAGEKNNSTSPPPPAAIPMFTGPSTLKPRLQRVRWLFVDLCREALAIFRMFVDMRYHVAWSTRILTVVLFLVILTSHIWLPIPNLLGMGPILDKMVDLILAFVMYKVLSREAARYRESRNYP